MTLESLHFLRPEWLWALLLLVPIGWSALRRSRGAGSWERVCDPHLLAELVAPGSGRAARWPLALIFLGWTAACLAMAGPAWERLPQATFREPSRTVFVLGLGDSMNQRDVRPSRLARARHKLVDALDRNAGGSIALVLYREEAFAVTPLTDDADVLREAVPLLETRLMPGRKVHPARGIEEARRLLEPAGLRGARILLVTDGADDDRDATLAALRAVAAEGAHVSVLGVAGDPDPLTALAQAGGGAYAALAADDGDLDRVLAHDVADTLGASLTQSETVTDTWNDMGAWLVWIPLLLAPLAFRKGWAGAALVALCLVQIDAAPASADVLDVFSRPDQRGARAFAEGRYPESAQAFEDPAWQAAARYRANDFQGAAEALAARPDAASQYNLGNALAKSGQLEPAVAAYDRALAANPGDADAKWNRDLVQKLIEQQQQQQQQEQQQDQKQRDQKQADQGQQSPEHQQAAKDESAKSEQADAEKNAPQDAEGGDASEKQTPDAAPQPTEAAKEQSEAQQGDASAQQEAAGDPGEDAPQAANGATTARPQSAEEQERAQWMARLPDDPGGLLREKIRRDYLRKQAARRGESVR